jgi:hypothetical protein
LKISSVFTWLLRLKKKIANTGCLYWVEKSCQRSLRASQCRKKETGRSTLLPQIIRRTYARSFLQLNMKQRQKAREELRQLRQLAKANILKHDNHTEFAYVLELPEKPGPIQKEFEIKKEASYIVSVKNPDIQIPGFKAFEKRKPQYPESLKKEFGDRRWINIEDPKLLDYENTQLLLIGARKKEVEEELGIDLNEEKETANTAELFRELKIRKDQVPLKPLLTGEFPGKGEQQPMTAEVLAKIF